MDNPELLQQMIRLNPQMNQIMEQNPEIAHMFNNPALLRQVMEMQRNPSMMQVYLLYVMTSIVHGQNDLLTPFDLRVQTFGVNMELSKDYHGQTQKS